MVLAPSGEQVEIALGEQRAVVVEVGGGLRSYAIAGSDIGSTARDREMSTSGRGQVLIPWPNRVQAGSYEFGGRRHQLALDEPSAGNAIHGLVRWAGWRVAEREANRVVVVHTLHPRPGYPFASRSRSSTRCRRRAPSADDRDECRDDPCPFGSGAHPYLTLGTGSVDSALLHVPARRCCIPRARHSRACSGPIETDYDFRQPRTIGATKLDTAFTDLERDQDGSPASSSGTPIATAGSRCGSTSATRT